ncbi:MAG: NFACT RNA binding domain-containing protein [Desulfovibrio sp.]|nr:NFACT RNA binding domain-containing protein [Desulfovibrio sp.]
MQRMFRDSARGARGLVIVRERRRLLQKGEGRSVPEESMAGGKAVGFPCRRQDGSETAAGKPPVPQTGQADAPVAGRRDLRDIANFRSSDGYLVLRGKNARGNQMILSLGRPYDLWLHARYGPGAHLLIRRAHAGDSVPDRTMLEAAVLAGQKSWQRGRDKAEIMVALLRHVHALKGAAPGTVRVDRELPGLTVPLPRAVQL